MTLFFSHAEIFKILAQHAADVSGHSGAVSVRIEATGRGPKGGAVFTATVELGELEPK